MTDKIKSNYVNDAFRQNKTKFEDMLKLDIQFFSEEPPADPVDPVDPVDPPVDITLTQAELDKKIEAEADRKLTKALEKKQTEWDESLAVKLAESQKEAERLAKLSEKERKDEELNQREKDLESRLAGIERKELLADAVAVLNEKKLPPSFAEILLAENAEKTFDNINSFKTTFDAAVAEKVKEALRQDTPPAGGGKADSSVGSKFAQSANQAVKAPENNIWG